MDTVHNPAGNRALRRVLGAHFRIPEHDPYNAETGQGEIVVKWKCIRTKNRGGV